jgi:hypothetical protein
VVVTPPRDLAINLQRVDDGVAIHLVRYDYEEIADQIPVLPQLSVDVRLPMSFAELAVHSPGGESTGSLTTMGNVHRLELRNVGLYAVALLTSSEREPG